MVQLPNLGGRSKDTSNSIKGINLMFQIFYLEGESLN